MEVDIKQVKHDFEDGTLICRSTIGKVIDMAIAGQSKNNHPDDFAVDQFATAMKAKMAAGRVRGRSGWNDPMLCSADSLRRLLAESVIKGDPVDVGNFAMMLFIREART